MNNVTLILAAIEHGEPNAAERLLALVYAELRRLAARKLARERPGQTLDATGLVHEAYMRLFTGRGDVQHWDSRQHFFTAAAEAMRRILVESARRKKRLRRGGDWQRVGLVVDDLAVHESPEDLLALNEALTNLAAEDSTAAEVIKLRYFAGLSMEQIADVLGFSRATTYRHWSYARAWLRCAIRADGSSPNA
jgi:RNA polymerase sigma factor (TIGR02999 family)